MTNDAKPDPLRELARDLPWDKPSDARRDAVRSSLLVEAAEGRAGDGGVGERGRAGQLGAGGVGRGRWLTIGGAFTAGALAAAAIAVLLLRRPGVDPIELPASSQITASSEAKLEHRIVATETGVDEIIEVHTGKVMLAVPPVRRGDHVRVRTTTADVDGDAGELEVVVVADALQSVTVHAGTARVSAAGQAPVFLAAGQTWHSAVITADLTPAHPDLVRAPAIGVSTAGATDERAARLLPDESATSRATDTVKTAPVDTVKTAPADTVKTAPVDTVKTAPADTVKTAPVDTVKTAPADTVKTAPVDTVKTAPADTVKTAPVDTVKTAPRTGASPTAPSVGSPSVAVEPATRPVDNGEPPAAPDRTKLAAVEKQFQQGWALLRDGKAREAAAILGAAADAMPETPLAQDARYFQAVALVRAGDLAAAEKVLVQFLDHALRSLRRGRAAVLLGRVLAMRGDRASARAWFESAVTDPDPAIAAAARAGLQSLAAK